MIMITEQDLDKIRDVQRLASRSKLVSNKIIAVELGEVLASIFSLQKERPNPAPRIVAPPGPTMEEVMAMRNGVEVSRHA